MSRIRDRAKAWLRRTVAKTGYRISRAAPNRFVAMQEALALLRSGGFDPVVVVDGGANVGAWSRMAYAIFPSLAEFHLIEPQPGCEPDLRRVQQQLPSVHLHRCALSRPGVERVVMAGTAARATATGAWVVSVGALATAVDRIAVPASTLDRLVGHRVKRARRVLLKLDLEGHELNALLGAERTLQAVEVIVVEVHFFDVNHGGSALFIDVERFLCDRGFDLFDIASLMPRGRDGRLMTGDAVFVRRGSPLLDDVRWS